MRRIMNEQCIHGELENINQTTQHTIEYRIYNAKHNTMTQKETFEEMKI